VRAAPKSERMARAQELVAQQGVPPMTAPVALALLLLLRDCVEATQDWKAVLAFVETLPEDLLELPEIQEHRAFAVAHAGQPAEAIGALETLIEEVGPSPERYGLLGGRLKRLNDLAGAIDAYERGRDLDLNEYYCVSNLARLYRKRGRKGDEERAQSALTLTIAACERAKKRGVADEWLRQTLLGAAFDLGDVDKAEELAEQVADEGAARWKIDSTLNDLAGSVAQIGDPVRRARLVGILDSLKRLAEPQGV
jgi:tetratricopeptide (TPR) repeat protein